MTAPDRTPHGQHRDPARPARGVRVFPALGAVVLVGLAVCASRRTGVPDRPAQANDPAQTQVTRAVTAANKYLETLDEKVRAQAVLDFDNPKKKTGWSNLPVT